MGYYHVGIQGFRGFRTQIQRTLLNMPHTRAHVVHDHRHRIAGSVLVGANRVTLRQGSTGPLVMELQQKLGLPVDSIFGPQTKAAVASFQQAHGLSSDGVVGPMTWSALDQVAAPPAVPVSLPTPEPNLQEGSIGAAVIELQHRLNITVDGIFGPDTRSAVVAFQTAHGLQPDGVVGPLTWAQLKGSTPPVPTAPGAQAVDAGTTGAPAPSPGPVLTPSTPAAPDQPQPVSLPNPQEAVTTALNDMAASAAAANTPSRRAPGPQVPQDSGGSTLPAVGVGVALALGLAVALSKKKRSA